MAHIENIYKFVDVINHLDVYKTNLLLMPQKIFYIVAILYIISLILPFILSKAGYDRDLTQAGLHWFVILLFPWIIPMVVLFVRLIKGYKVDLLYYLVIVPVSLLLLLEIVPLLEFLERVIG